MYCIAFIHMSYLSVPWTRGVAGRFGYSNPFGQLERAWSA